MKITLTGCGNRGHTRTRDSRPWYGKFGVNNVNRLYYSEGGHPGSPDDPAHWLFGRFAPGLVKGLWLNGDYQVTLEFEDSELKNWLKNYIEHKPDEALDLIEEMLPEALKASKARHKIAE